MTNIKAKTINLLLNEGTLDGVISIQDTGWNAGEMYSAPRSSSEDLIKSGACNKFGVYLLLSDEKVYVGQSNDLAKRIKQHKVGKDWWQRVVIITTSDDSFVRSDIDYLESLLIERANKLNTIDCDNKNKGNVPKVDKFKKVALDQYLEEVLFLLELIGITVFKEKAKSKKRNTKLIETVKKQSNEDIAVIGKKESIQYLIDKKHKINKNVSYAKLQEKKPVFWINPPMDYLKKDWDIVLNNTEEHKLILMKVPANTFSKSKTNSLKHRKDRPDILDINIDKNSYVDKVSKCEFKKFIKTTEKY